MTFNQIFRKHLYVRVFFQNYSIKKYNTKTTIATTLQNKLKNDTN